MQSLETILPIYTIEKDVIVSKKADVTIGYRLQLPEIFTFGELQMEHLLQCWVKALALLPIGTIVHKQDWFVREQYVADYSDSQDFLQQHSERFFIDRPYLNHTCNLFFTLRANKRKLPDSAGSTLLKRHLVSDEMLQESTLHSFIGHVEQSLQVLCDASFIHACRLNSQDLIKSLNHYLSLNGDGIVRDIVFEEGIQIGELYCTLFSLSEANDLPQQVSSSGVYSPYTTDQHKFPIGFASAVGSLLSCNHLYSQFIVIDDTISLRSGLEARKLRLQSLSPYARENAFARDTIQEFLSVAVEGNHAMVRAHYHLLAWTDHKEQVPVINKQCAAAISKLGARPRIETVGAPQIFWAGIPGNAGDLPINETFISFSEAAVCLFNHETHYQSSMSPVGIRLGDRISGKPLHVDLSDEPMRLGLTTNRNKIVIGPSGSGKSFFTNHLLHGYHLQGAHAVVVDMGNSYAGLCELLGGTYFTYTATSPIAFNPFYVSGNLDSEKSESIKTLLIALWKNEDESFVRSEYVALSQALQLYYQKEISFRCFDSFYEFIRDEFVLTIQREGIQGKDFDAANFLYVLRPYYKGGEFDFLLNATQNLDLLHSRFIVFEIDTIKDHPILFPVVTIIIMELFMAKMRGLPGVRKIILIEEAWKAIAKAGMADYVKYLFKTVRKYYGEAIVVTQDLDDILNSDIIRQTIVNNADMKILLDQRKYEQRFKDVQQMLGLPDREVPKVLSLNKANDPTKQYKEVYIWPLAKVYRVEASPEAYLCYTTEEKEKIKVKEAAIQHGSLERGIKSLLLSVVFALVSICGKAQVPIVGEVVSQVIKNIDLKIQQLQMKELKLQQLQKLLENKLHDLELKKMREWSQRQKELYRQYYEELSQVKAVLIRPEQLQDIQKQKLPL